MAKNGLETLREEFKRLYDVAPTGSNVKVAEKIGKSISYLWQIKNGRNATVNTPENRKLLKSICSAYRKIIDKEVKRLTSV